jgi:hypothetical protein
MEVIDQENAFYEASGFQSPRREREPSMKHSNPELQQPDRQGSETDQHHR